MRKTILITTALLASTALAAAQGMSQSNPQGGKEGASPAPSVQRSAPAEKMDQRDQSRGAQSKPAETSGQAQGSAAQKAGEANQPSKAASDTKLDDSKAMPSRADTQKPMDNKADANKAAEDKSKADTNRAASDTKAGEASRSTTTTGQGAAGTRTKVNLSSEQKTTVRTVIREKVKAQPLTNVNFSINVGTRVPRDVRYYPVPAELVTINPGWRGYHFILVNDQIVIIDPATFEIVEIIIV